MFTATAETAVWSFEVPDNFEPSADINARIRFQVASGTNGVCWDASWLGRTTDETVDATFGTLASGCDTSTGTNQIEVVSLTWTSAQHGLAAGDVVFFKLERDVTAGQDQNTNDARLIDVRITWS